MNPCALFFVLALSAVVQAQTPALYYMSPYFSPYYNYPTSSYRQSYSNNYTIGYSGRLSGACLPTTPALGTGSNRWTCIPATSNPEIYSQIQIEQCSGDACTNCNSSSAVLRSNEYCELMIPAVKYVAITPTPVTLGGEEYRWTLSNDCSGNPVSIDFSNFASTSNCSTYPYYSFGPATCNATTLTSYSIYNSSNCQGASTFWVGYVLSSCTASRNGTYVQQCILAGQPYGVAPPVVAGRPGSSSGASIAASLIQLTSMLAITVLLAMRA